MFIRHTLMELMEKANATSESTEIAFFERPSERLFNQPLSTYAGPFQDLHLAAFYLCLFQEFSLHSAKTPVLCWLR